MFKIPVAAVALLISGSALAGLDNVTFNGFGSVVASTVINSDRNNSDDEYYLRGGNCPCFITDYYTGGLLNEDDGVTLKNESRLGLQMDIALAEQVNFTSQIVARSLTNEFTLEWAYLTYQINSDWNLQLGRKRIPLYYFSTFQDVGLAYTWVRPPQALYGWEASNYNGINVSYSGSIGDVSLSASAYAGKETISNSRYNTLYTDDPTITDDSKWDDIRGFDVELTYEWFNARFIYLQSNNSATDKAAGDYQFTGPETEQRVMGLAVNGDFDNWFFHIEKSENRRDTPADDPAEATLVKAPADMMAIGVRVGKWTPFVSWSRYWEKSDSEAYQGGEERFTITSLTLRYDVNANNAVKVQVEKFNDQSQFTFVGDSTVLSLSYDFVF